MKVKHGLKILLPRIHASDKEKVGEPVLRMRPDQQEVGEMSVEEEEEILGAATKILKRARSLLFTKRQIQGYRTKDKEIEEPTMLGKGVLKLMEFEEEMRDAMETLARLMKRAGSRAVLAGALGLTAATASAGMEQVFSQPERQRQEDRIAELEERLAMKDDMLRSQAESQEEFGLAERAAERLFRSRALDDILEKMDKPGFKKEAERVLLEAYASRSVLPEDFLPATNSYRYLNRYLTNRLQHMAKVMAHTQPEKALRLVELLEGDPLDLFEDIPAAKRTALLPEAFHRYLQRGDFNDHQIALWSAVLNDIDAIQQLAPHLPAEDQANIRHTIQVELNAIHAREKEGQSLSTDEEQRRKLQHVLPMLRSH